MTIKYKADKFGTAVLTLADSTASSIPVPGSLGIVIGFAANSNMHFMVYSRSSGSPNTTTINIGSSVNNAGTVVLSGTTGNSGTLNISSNGGLFYVENRTGVTQTVHLTVIGG